LFDFYFNMIIMIDAVQFIGHELTRLSFYNVSKVPLNSTTLNQREQNWDALFRLVKKERPKILLQQ